MTSKTQTPPATYPIGVASRLTNIHPETLRIWERRYRMVEPARASRGRRFYSQADIRRLSLVKALVDEGNPISSVARLSVEELEERLKTSAGATLLKLPAAPAGPCRVIVIGEELPVRLAEEGGELELVATYAEAKDLRLQPRSAAVDVLLWERAAIHADTVQEVFGLLSASKAKRAIIVYGFGSRRAIADLEAAGVHCIQTRASGEAIKRRCLEVKERATATLQVSVPAPQAIPPRRFSPAQLGRIARSSPAMACECPHHMVDLVNNLAAFEKYSEECESRNPADAALHALLHSITATARALMETGLERVVKAEGIDPG
jgi:MerR family transcriptional regulator, light-induced transcriptional regulator